MASSVLGYLLPVCLWYLFLTLADEAEYLESDSQEKTETLGPSKEQSGDPSVAPKNSGTLCNNYLLKMYICEHG